MRAEDISEAMEYIDERLIIAADEKRQRQAKAVRKNPVWTAIAACAACVGIIGGVIAFRSISEAPGITAQDESYGETAGAKDTAADAEPPTGQTPAAAGYVTEQTTAASASEDAETMPENEAEETSAPENTAESAAPDTAAYTAETTKPETTAYTAETTAPETTADTTAPADSRPVSVAEDDMEYADFDTFIEHSAAVVTAICTDVIYADPDKQVYACEVTGQLAGIEMPDKFELTVSTMYDYDDDDDEPELPLLLNIGTEYLIPVDKRISVFYENDMYRLSGQIIIPIDNDGNIISASIQGMEAVLPFDSVEGFKAMGYVCGESEEDFGTPFIVSDDLKTVIDASEYVMEIEAASVREAKDRCVITGIITEMYKSPSGLLNGKGLEIYAAVPKPAAEGKRYVLALNRCGPKSIVYVVSSINLSAAESGTEEAERMIELAKK